MKHLQEMIELLELTEAKNSSLASIRNTVIMLVQHLIKMIVTKVPTTTRVYWCKEIANFLNQMSDDFKSLPNKKFQHPTPAILKCILFCSSQDPVFSEVSRTFTNLSLTGERAVFDKMVESIMKDPNYSEFRIGKMKNQTWQESFETLEKTCHYLSMYLYKNFGKFFTTEMIKNELSQIEELDF